MHSATGVACPQSYHSEIYITMKGLRQLGGVYERPSLAC